MKKGTIILLLVLFFVVLPALGFIGKVVFFPAHVATKSVDMIYEATDKTLTGDNLLSNYEWFKMQYESWIAIDQQIQLADKAVQNHIDTLPADKEKWKYDDKNELSRLRSIADGLRFQQQDIIKEYNAKSKMINRNLFKDKGLPHQLDVTPTPVQ